MNKIRLALVMAMIVSAQQVFAGDDSDKPCANIAKACTEAGFDKGGSEDKRFWEDCMKPILYGKTVSGVTVDAADVKSCRLDKIKEYKKELKELQKVH